jgi:monomeric sarcosine oxidase
MARDRVERAPMSEGHTDVVVIGGGAMGTAAGWAIARRGHSVRVLEQFSHVNAMASHGGISRIFRHAYAEGEDYVPWALAADDAWHGLQERSGTSIIHRIGCLDMAAPGYDHAALARGSADAYQLDYDWIDGAEVRKRFPIWNVPDDWEACYTPRAGYVEVGPAMRALAAEMEAAGGTLETDCRVSGWSADAEGVRVETAGDAYTADRLVVTGGAWNVHLLAALGLPLEVRRKPVLWFESDRPDLIVPDVFPCWIAECDLGHPYGLPQVDVPGFKAGMHSGGEPVDPETLDREVHPADVETALGPFLQRYMHHVTGRLTQSAVCMYTMTPDENFIIDRHPEHGNVVFAAGFSGHGFKFTPVVGEHLADLALDPAARPRPLFALDRFAAAR